MGPQSAMPQARLLSVLRTDAPLRALMSGPLALLLPQGRCLRQLIKAGSVARSESSLPGRARCRRRFSQARPSPHVRRKCDVLWPPASRSRRRSPSVPGRKAVPHRVPSPCVHPRESADPDPRDREPQTAPESRAPTSPSRRSLHRATYLPSKWRTSREKVRRPRIRPQPPCPSRDRTTRC
jgi:hypothetical protein